MELNRSDRQTEFQDRELIEAVLSKTDEQCRLNDSGGSRLSSIVLPRASLRSTGNLSRPASFVSHGSRRSVTLSQDKLSDSIDDDIDKETKSNYREIQQNIIVMILLCMSSLILGLITIQLLIGVSDQKQTTVHGQINLIGSNRTLMTITEVATALSMFVVVCDVTCLLVCSLQCIVVVKLLMLSLGDERALKYLDECSIFRYVAVSGFFVSIPVFLVCLMLYVILQFSSVAAITSIVILIVGGIFCILSLIQNFYHWRMERSRAISGLPVFDLCTAPPVGKELSTLV
ncbi:hypothetical protein ACF0H5_004051 [Mactra antiquata]